MSSSRRRRYRRKMERSKAAFVLPNLFTSISLLSGFFAMVSAMDGDFLFAALGILNSLIFDFLDGKVARATGAVSKFGMEYDSLSDLVAFGVAPAVTLYLWALKPFGRLGWLAAFLYVACGALRLARFNVQAEVVGTKHFVGLPIPGAAAMVATTLFLCQRLDLAVPLGGWPLVIMVFTLSFLMVSNIPWLSFKDVGLDRLKSFNGLVLGLLLIILVAIQPEVVLFSVMAIYVCLGPLGARIMARKRAEAEEAKAVEEKVTTA